MNTEQKAKAYDEAINKLQSLINNANKQGHIIVRVEDIENSFPELAESEDEKIRKWLLDFVQGLPDEGLDFKFYNQNKEQVITWLEKLKAFTEHGDGLYYFANSEFIYVDNPACDNVSLLEKQGESSDQIHYWTEEEIEPIISDYLRGAEHYGGMIGRLRCLKPKSLEKQGEPTNINPSEFDLRLNKLLKQFETLPKEELASSLSFYLNVVQNDGIYKADKKQGEQKPLYSNSDMVEALRTEYEKGRADAFAQMQKEWSEEDEKNFRDIISAIHAVAYQTTEDEEARIDWLKSLKDRYTWKPSDEQIVVLELASKYERVFTPKQIDILIDLKEQLKKLTE